MSRAECQVAPCAWGVRCAAVGEKHDVAVELAGKYEVQAWQSLLPLSLVRCRDSLLVNVLL